MRMPFHVLTEPHITDSSGSTDFDEPARIQHQDAMFQTPPRVLTRTRVLTDEEIDSFTDSSGRIDLDAMLLSWQNDPAPVAFLPQPQLTLEEIYSRIRTPTRVLTDEEIASFTDSSGLIELDAMLFSRQNDPARYQPQDDINPARQPEMMSHEAYILRSQSKGLSKGTISKYLKTRSADEIRDQDKDGDRKICALCLDDLCGQKDKIAILDECRHEFHYCCLERWLRRKNICPLCRRTAIYLLQDR